MTWRASESDELPQRLDVLLDRLVDRRDERAVVARELLRRLSDLLGRGAVDRGVEQPLDLSELAPERRVAGAHVRLDGLAGLLDLLEDALRSALRRLRDRHGHAALGASELAGEGVGELLEVALDLLGDPLHAGRQRVDVAGAAGERRCAESEDGAIAHHVCASVVGDARDLLRDLRGDDRQPRDVDALAGRDLHLLVTRREGCDVGCHAASPPWWSGPDPEFSGFPTKEDLGAGPVECTPQLIACTRRTCQEWPCSFE